MKFVYISLLNIHEYIFLKFSTVNAYIKHMGGKHRLINKFMTPGKDSALLYFSGPKIYSAKFW